MVLDKSHKLSMGIPLSRASPSFLLISINHDGNSAWVAGYTVIVVGGALYISQTVVNRIQFKCSIAVVVLKELHDSVGTE